MTNQSLAQSCLEKSSKRLKILDVLLVEEDYSKENALQAIAWAKKAVSAAEKVISR